VLKVGYIFFCVKTYCLINLCALVIMKLFTRTNVHFLVSNPCKTKCLDVCDELLSECSLPKDQVLGTWVLVQQHVGFISCILQVFWMA